MKKNKEKFNEEEISLCPHCFCMTLTLNNGKCGKCKSKKTIDRTGKRFDEVIEKNQPEWYKRIKK